MGACASRETGRDPSFLHGPGESPDSRGEGRGVTSAIALSIGDDKAEFGADPSPLPALEAKMFLTLGVRAKGMFLGFVPNRVLSLLPMVCTCPSEVVGESVQFGVMSVRIRRPALRGLDCGATSEVRKRVGVEDVEE